MNTKVYNELLHMNQILQKLDSDLNELSGYADRYPFINKNLGQIKAIIGLIKEESLKNNLNELI